MNDTKKGYTNKLVNCNGIQYGLKLLQKKYSPFIIYRLKDVAKKS